MGRIPFCISEYADLLHVQVAKNIMVVIPNCVFLRGGGAYLKSSDVTETLPLIGSVPCDVSWM